MHTTNMENKFDPNIILPKLDTNEMSEVFRLAANHMDKVNKVVRIMEQAKKDNINGLIF